MTDEQNMYGAETNPEESATTFWAAARRARSKLLLRLRTSRPLSAFRGPFRSPMDKTSLEIFEDIVIRTTYGCPYCNARHVYEMQDHYWEPPVPG